MKYTLFYLSCGLALSFPLFSYGAIDGKNAASEVNVEITRGGREITDLSSTFHAMYYILTNGTGAVVESKTLDNEALSNFEGISFDLENGQYTLYIMGEGSKENFTHPTAEVQTPSDANSVWFKNIRFQPLKREVFHAVEEFEVGTSGSSRINLTSELVRKNGTVEITIPSEISEVLSVVLLVPDAYVANAMNVDGSMTFLNDTNGSGYFWTYAVKKDETDGIYRVQMLPSMEYVGETKPRIITTCKLDGAIKNIETSLDGFVVEPNKVTKINVQL